MRDLNRDGDIRRHPLESRPHNLEIQSDGFLRPEPEGACLLLEGLEVPDKDLPRNSDCATSNHEDPSQLSRAFLEISLLPDESGYPIRLPIMSRGRVLS